MNNFFTIYASSTIKVYAPLRQLKPLSISSNFATEDHGSLKNSIKSSQHAYMRNDKLRPVSEARLAHAQREKESIVEAS